EPDVIALACGDIDGDGGMELAVVSRARVQIGHIKAGRFVAARSVNWSALSPRAPAPLREPIGGAAFGAGERRGRLYVGTTDRGGVELDESLAVRAQLRGIPLFDAGAGCATPAAEVGAFEGAIVPCERDASPLPGVRRAKPDGDDRGD